MSPEQHAELALRPIGSQDVPHPLTPIEAARCEEEDPFIAMTHFIYRAYEQQALLQQWALGPDDAPAPAFAASGKVDMAEFKEEQKQRTVAWIMDVQTTMDRMNQKLMAEKAGLLKTRATEFEIARKYQKTALTRQEALGMGATEKEAREWEIAARLAQFKTVHAVSDLDNTITKQRGGDPFYLSRLNGSVHGEFTLKKSNNRGNFAYAYAAFWQPAMREHQAGFENAGQRAQLRPGVIEFFNSGIPVTVLSANFDPYVRAKVDDIRRQSPSANIRRVYAIGYDDINASDKATIMIKTAVANPEEAIAYMGDGSSDIIAMQARHVTAVYFALDGSEFADELEKEGLPYLTYNDFNEIQEKMVRLEAMANIFREAEANNQRSQAA